MRRGTLLVAALLVGACATALIARVTVAAGPDRAPVPSAAAADPRTAPAGAPGDGAPAAVDGPVGFTVWAVDADGRTVRWDPCRPVRVVVDLTGAPDGVLEDLDRALLDVSSWSGLTLRREAIVTERPSATRPPHQPARYGERWAPVLVAWAEPGEGGLPLRAVDRGLTVPVAVADDDGHAFVTGQVVLNARRDDLVVGGRDRADAWFATLVHELGHLVGLGHVDDPQELMAADPGRGPVRPGPGDRAGLAHVGPSGAGGCVATPRPGPVRVAPPDPDAVTGVHPGR